MRRRTFYAWLFITLSAIMCSACGGGGSKSTASTTSYIRLVNATQVDNLTLSASTSAVNSNVAAGTASAYASLTAGTYSVIVSAANNALATSATSSIGVTADVYNTVVAYARGGQIKLLSIIDNKSAPASGFTSLTIANADSDAGALDVYVVAPGTSIADLTATFANVTPTGVSLTNSVTAGTYDIVVTAYNKPADVRLTMSSVTLSSLEIATLALTSTSGGSLVNGVIVQQQGSMQLQAANKARVRVVGALPATGNSNANVVATVGGVALNVTSPSVGNYGLVPANTTAYSVSVNGTPIANLAAATFASGGDYSLMVYGTSGAPQVKLLTDNNLLPTSGAKIRLVNGAVSESGLSLTDNFVTLFQEPIAFGNASDYSGITTGASSLPVASAASGFTITFTNYSSSSVNILSNSVYSLFVLGSTANAQTILVKDK